jgi:uncharacterized RDD family membrane protein YckC/Tfp pilus assembly major pilin PilA
VGIDSALWGSDLSEHAWFYANSSGTHEGPVDASFLQDAVRRGQLTSSTLVWREGMSQWAPFSASELNEGAGTLLNSGVAISHPPPLPIGPTHLQSQEVQYAGFWRRYFALFLDQMILSVPLVVAGLGIAFSLGWFNKAPAQSLPAFQGLFYLIYFLAAPFYYALQESSRYQATLGKRALGIKVTDLAGGRLTFANALGRWFAAILSYLTFYIGFVMAAFTQRKQALHDMVAKTLVVDQWAYTEFPERQKTGLSGCLIAFIAVLFIGIPVLGILMAIAIPAYQDYTVRAKVAEALNASAPVKLAVAELFANNARCPTTGQDGLPSADSYSTAHVRSISAAVMQNGRCGLEIVIKDASNSTIDGKRIWLELSPDKLNPNWSCSSDLPNKDLPPTCRN